MRLVILSACVAVSAAAAGGCRNREHERAPRYANEHRRMNEALIQSYNLEAIDAAVIRQHTIYPYHFVANSDQLNALGRREVYLLTQHYRDHPGALNVRRGPENDDLYQSRVDAVRLAMTDGGVAANRLNIEDGMPGGDGLPAEQVVIVLERMVEVTEMSGYSGRPSGADRAAQGAGGTGGATGGGAGRGGTAGQGTTATGAPRQ
jgi:hypothetical protein